MIFPSSVIFDTNAYRTLTRKKTLAEVRRLAAELRTKEAAVGVTALAHPIVIWELLAHLSGPQDEDFDNCLNSIVAMGVHTELPAMTGGIALVADSDSTASLPLFGTVNPDYGKGVLAMGTMVTHIVNNAPDLSDKKCQENIAHLSTSMAKRETDWLRSMKAVTDQFCPGAIEATFGKGNDKKGRAAAHAFFSSPQFFEVWSTVIVQRAALSIKSPLNHALTKEKAEIVRQIFVTPYRLFQALILQLVSPSPPMLENPKRKRWNFIWDSMISFSIGPGSVNEKPVYMVTGDGAIIDAAKAAGFSNQVVSLVEYKRELDSK